jgi:hypothetical protein
VQLSLEATFLAVQIPDIEEYAMSRAKSVFLVFLLLSAMRIVAAQSSVTIVGDLQSELGCPGNWQPDCATTYLTYDANDDVWQGTFNIPAGAWQYRAALDDGWTEAYPPSNVDLGLGAASDVKFYYDHKTHVIVDSINAEIPVVVGDFQSGLGCAGNWQPDCLRGWLQDPDGDGTFTFMTSAIPAGSYGAQVAHNESWDESYGQGGVPSGPNIAFTVGSNPILFSYDLGTHILTISSVVLPVELAAFEVLAHADGVLLTWSTFSETNNQGFAVEHQESGGEFEKIGFVAGHGTSDVENRYKFEVTDLDPGLHRFRLKQIDFDGAFDYSPAVEATLTVPDLFVIDPAYPNPFNPSTTVRFAVAVEQQVEVTLINAAGQTVKTLYRRVAPADEMQTIMLDAAELPSGVYLVRFEGAQGMSAVERIVLAK